jgi:hypothetical protein
MKSAKKIAAAGTPAAIIESNHAYRIKAALAADAEAKRSGVKVRAHAPRGPPAGKVDLASVQERLTHRVGLLGKREIVALAGVSYPSMEMDARRDISARPCCQRQD